MIIAGLIFRLIDRLIDNVAVTLRHPPPENRGRNRATQRRNLQESRRGRIVRKGEEKQRNRLGRIQEENRRKKRRTQETGQSRLHSHSFLR